MLKRIFVTKNILNSRKLFTCGVFLCLILGFNWGIYAQKYQVNGGGLGSIEKGYLQSKNYNNSEGGGLFSLNTISTFAKSNNFMVVPSYLSKNIEANSTSQEDTENEIHSSSPKLSENLELGDLYVDNQDALADALRQYFNQGVLPEFLNENQRKLFADQGPKFIKELNKGDYIVDALGIPSLNNKKLECEKFLALLKANKKDLIIHQPVKKSSVFHSSASKKIQKVNLIKSDKSTNLASFQTIPVMMMSQNQSLDLTVSEKIIELYDKSDRGIFWKEASHFLFLIILIFIIFQLGILGFLVWFIVQKNKNKN